MQPQINDYLSAHTSASPAVYALPGNAADGFPPSLESNKASNELDQDFNAWFMGEQMLDMSFQMISSSASTEGSEYLASPDTWYTQTFGHPAL